MMITREEKEIIDVIHSVSKIAVQATDVHHIFDALFREFSAIPVFAGGTIIVEDNNGATRKHYGSLYHELGEFIEETESRTMESGELIIVDEIFCSSGDSGNGQHGPLTCYSMPLMYGIEVLGALSLFFTSPVPQGRDDLMFLAAIISQAMIIERSTDWNNIQHSGSLQEMLNMYEKKAILNTLKELYGNISISAKKLGLTERKLRLRLEKHHINHKEFRLPGREYH
jgi:transcriptional regulator with GAF, ATPase, and Fis domain